MTFKKGQLVTFISDWDRRGTVTYRHAVVYSCGKKQMVLTDAVTGEEMGRHFKPAEGSLEVIHSGRGYVMAGGTFPRMTEDEAIAASLKVAEAIQKYEREHFARRLGQGNGEFYDKAIQRDLDALHEPRAIAYSAAKEQVVKAINAT